jgi:hypothetical protein
MFLRSDVTMDILRNVIRVPVIIMLSQRMQQKKKGHHILQARVEQINSSLLSFFKCTRSIQQALLKGSMYKKCAI